MRLETYGRRLGVAVALGAAIVVSAPVLGKARDALLDAFGSRFLAVMAFGLASCGAVAFLAALRRIREDRFRRYGLLLAAAGLVILQVWWWQTGDRRVDLVERVHLVEYGGLALLFHRAFAVRHRGIVLVLRTLLAVGTVGTFDELVQWWSPIRSGDQRDVWLNLFAGTIGLLIATSLPPVAGTSRETTENRRGLLGACLLFVASFGGLIDLAHLGSVAGDEEVRFRSFFPADRLPALAADRAARWAQEPPRLVAYGQEDFFLTEAAWHVQARNTAWDAGDFVQAWGENRILERWYGPFLELKSFRSGVAHRWPPAQRAQAETALALVPRPYWSPVLAERVWTGTAATAIRWGFLTLAGLLALAWLRELSRRRGFRP